MLLKCNEFGQYNTNPPTQLGKAVLDVPVGYADELGKFSDTIFFPRFNILLPLIV